MHGINDLTLEFTFFKLLLNIEHYGEIIMALFTGLKTKYADYRLNKINELENSITNQLDV